ncbi:MAG: N-acetylmuramoyl-L-alanine amidase [Nitrospiraceae bacterium]|nr:N-acetylmuramoyl-L-alanine amidase [Nitrospiraceae bacterium]
MKTFAAIILMALLSARALSAEQTAEVSLRYSRQGSMIRVVIEAPDETIRNSVVHAAPAGIRIDFAAAFEIRKPADFIFQTAKSDRSLSIALKDVREVKTSMLTAPARIVFDITTSPAVTSFPGPVASPGPHPQAPAPPAAPRAGQNTTQPAPRLPGARVVLLDPGHGGYEYGIVDDTAREKDVNLALARDLGTALSRKGKAAFLTRKADQSTSLADRISLANAKAPDLFISIHAGLSPHFVIYLATPEDQSSDAAVRLYALSYRQDRYLAKSRAAAAAIGLSIKSDFGAEVTLRELPLPVLTSINGPAILIEYPSLKAYASDQKLRDKLVSSIVKGIGAYER